MSYDTASSSSSRSKHRPVLPPSLHLTSSQQNDETKGLGGSKLFVKCFHRALHHIIFPRRYSEVARLESVPEAVAEDENATHSTRSSNCMEGETLVRSVSSRFSPTYITSKSTGLTISTSQCSSTALITSLPLLNISDIPSRSPTNKSPFSAFLLAEEDGEDEEDHPTLALWKTEQLYRARLAKLTRHLGEEIPAELVLTPSILSHGSLRSSGLSRRSGSHRKRRSLDPSAFRQELSVTEFTEGVLRKSKSLKVQGGIHPSSSVTANITPRTPKTVGRFCKVEFMKQTPVHTTETQSDIPNNNVLHARESLDPYSASILSDPPHLSSIETSETSPFVFSASCASRVPQRSKTFPRRPVTADVSRRAEKLADFFGVDDEDVLEVTQACEEARKVQSSYVNAAGDLAVGIYAPLVNSQLEVEVKVNKPNRFWSGRATRRIHPDDVRDKLRAMRAS